MPDTTWGNGNSGNKVTVKFKDGSSQQEAAPLGAARINEIAQGRGYKKFNVMRTGSLLEVGTVVNDGEITIEEYNEVKHTWIC